MTSSVGIMITPNNVMSRGVNLINFLYQPSMSSTFSFPVAFEIVEKTEKFVDPKDGKHKRRSSRNKNEMVRDRLRITLQMKTLSLYTKN
jgi:hypothetical protein